MIFGGDEGVYIGSIIGIIYGGIGGTAIGFSRCTTERTRPAVAIVGKLDGIGDDDLSICHH